MELLMYYLMVTSAGLRQMASSYEIENIALLANTMTSSVHHGRSASRAVDGNTDTDINSNSCTHTNDEENPWWKADFGDNFIVTGVTIYNRGDCCWDRLKNFTVTLTPLLSQNEETFEVPSLCSYYFSGSAAKGQLLNFECPGPVYARFVQVQIHDAQEFLTLCEVQVWGANIRPTPCPVYTKLSGRKVSSMIVGLQTANTIQKCFFACVKTPNCYSLNIFTNVTSYTCEFLNDIHEQKDTDVIDTVGWCYYRVLL